MSNTMINDVIANIASTSRILENFCNDPKNYNTAGAEVLEKISLDLNRKIEDLKEIQFLYGF